MRRTLWIPLFFILSLTLQSQINQVVTDEKGNKMLLGETNREAFKDSYFKWFDQNHKKYMTNDKIIKELKKDLNGYEIKVFFGSWCGDSKRNLPVFYKVIEEAGLPKENLKVYALDRKKEAYKQSPNKDEKGLNIHRVPTFIIYKGGKEVNRIVEHPKETFERDLLKIVRGERYYPNYRGVQVLDNLLKNAKDSLQFMEEQLIRYLPEVTEGTKELNTYGFVKLRNKEFDKAEFAFKLNTKMYPKNYVTYSSLGTLYYEQKKYKEALQQMYKALSLNPDEKRIKEMITKINESL
ncbi:thioredoxin family protein [Tenacibaculum sp. 190524A05c]|uniref:thioredoxin family protein n=1 Tax=Tenacibaculum platacis TaxID=3137852 RepID=UPI0031FAFC45